MTFIMWENTNTKISCNISGSNDDNTLFSYHSVTDVRNSFILLLHSFTTREATAVIVHTESVVSTKKYGHNIESKWRGEHVDHEIRLFCSTLSMVYPDKLLKKHFTCVNKIERNFTRLFCINYANLMKLQHDEIINPLLVPQWRNLGV